MSTLPPEHHRTIRSFVRRQGRMTQAQKQALTESWPQFGLEISDAPLDFATVFPTSQPIILEIGFGQGHTLATMASEQPEHNFIGIEVHKPGVGNCLIHAKDHNLTNLRVFCADAKEVLQHSIPDASLAKIYLLFPDPWHKKRHHKRRLIQLEFIATLVSKLQSSGILHIATDWEAYAEHIAEVLANTNTLQQASEDTSSRPSTKYEQRGKHLGHAVFDFVYRKASP